MVTARKPRATTAARARARRTQAKGAGAMPRKVDKIIKRRAPAIRELN